VKNIPVFIVNRNLLTWPKRMVEQLHSWGMKNIMIVDNASTYEPLLEWYENCDVRVIRLDENLGPRAVWHAGLNKDVEDLYIVTDPDLDLSNLPGDVLDLLLVGLARFPMVRKVGLGLKKPTNPALLTPEAEQTEARWHSCPLDDQFFSALVDTTFALYSKSRDHLWFFYGVRTREPYEAVHLPWTEAIREIKEEYRYYLEHSNLSSGAKENFLKEVD